jgi:hypothetical protein
MLQKGEVALFAGHGASVWRSAKYNSPSPNSTTEDIGLDPVVKNPRTDDPTCESHLRHRGRRVCLEKLRRGWPNCSGLCHCTLQCKVVCII